MRCLLIIFYVNLCAAVHIILNVCVCVCTVLVESYVNGSCVYVHLSPVIRVRLQLCSKLHAN